jgi:hypothetical protein
VSKRDDKRAKKAKKKAVKAQRKHEAAFPELCPKCSHAAHLHGRRQSMYSLMMMFDHSPGRCGGKVEKSDADGTWRVVYCDCDLTPAEAQLNATKGLAKTDLATLSKIRMPEAP